MNQNSKLPLLPPYLREKYELLGFIASGTYSKVVGSINYYQIGLSRQKYSNQSTCCNKNLSKCLLRCY